MSDIFQEVDEDLRAERARNLALRYGGVVIGIALAIVVAAGLWQAWRWYDARRAAEVAQTYLDGLRLAGAPGVVADHASAIADFDKTVATGREGYATLARLFAGALLADENKPDDARARWDAIANDGSADPILRDLARLSAITHALDTGDPADLQARLAPLAEPSNPWHALAMEAQALLAIRRGAPEEARQTLRLIAQDATAPDGVRGRANGLLTRLGG